jgi:hypothetical protein
MPGEMTGAGFVRARNLKYEFNLAVSETASGVERVRFVLNSKGGHFSATSMSSCRFGDHSVVFTGLGRWKGVRGYRYTVYAGDDVARGRKRPDVLRVTITDPRGRVVVKFDEPVGGGHLQWRRLRKAPDSRRR